MPDIDYEAVCRQLQHENETLRLTILALRNKPLVSLDAEQVRSFLTRNYIAIAALGTIFFIVASLLDTARGLLSNR